jgi:hypothetical protein
VLTFNRGETLIGGMLVAYSMNKILGTFFLVKYSSKQTDGTVGAAKQRLVQFILSHAVHYITEALQVSFDFFLLNSLLFSVSERIYCPISIYFRRIITITLHLLSIFWQPHYYLAYNLTSLISIFVFVFCRIHDLGMFQSPLLQLIIPELDWRNGVGQLISPLCFINSTINK